MVYHMFIIFHNRNYIMNHSYFNQDAIDKAYAQSLDSRDILIYMHPKDFLHVAMSGFSEDKMNNVRNLSQDNILFNEIPFLNFVHDGEGTARVTGHEGRHRARLLLENNITEMLVLLRHRYDENGQAMLWHTMNSENNKFYDMWPERLYGERGDSEATNQHSRNYITFPIEDLRVIPQDNISITLKS